MKIAIASGKGGTGKTTLAANLAAFIAEEAPVILADLDVEAPNSGQFFTLEEVRRHDHHKMYPEWNPKTCEACGQCQEVCNFNAIVQLGKEIMVFPELCHSCYACAELCPTGSLTMVPQKTGELRHFQASKLTFVESRLDIGQEQAVPLISQTLDYVATQLPEAPLRVFDAPPGTSCPMIEATKDADYVVLVTEPTPFGMHDLKLAVETMQKLEQSFGVVVNRWGIGNHDVLNYCKALDIPVIAKIPNDREVATHYSHSRLLYPYVPTFRQALEDVAAHIHNLEKQIEA